MNQTLHDLHLKFIVKHKITGNIVAAFQSGTAAQHYIDTVREMGSDDHEMKESY